MGGGGGGAKPKKKFIPRKKLEKKNLPRHSAKKKIPSLEDTELPSLTVYPWVSRFSRWPPGLTGGRLNLTESHKNTILRKYKFEIKKPKSKKGRDLLFK